MPPLETNNAVVVCDSDPLKLHYSWYLGRLGAASWERFEKELVEVRRAVDALEPGRVTWRLPAGGRPARRIGPRSHRSDPDRLDELVVLLPAP